MKKQLTLLFLLFSIIKSLNAQQDLPIGYWKSLLPYQNGNFVTQSENKVFYTTPLSLFSIEKTSLQPTFISKVDGLSDVGTSTLKYNPNNKTLLVTYSNSNLDLIREDGTIINIPDIKNNLNVIGDKSIFNIYFYNNLAYLSCGFGLVILDTETESFVTTVFTNTKVNNATVFENNIYIATEKGVFYVENNNPNINIADFGQWQLYAYSYNTPSNVIATWNNKLYFDRNDTLYSITNNNLEFVNFYNNYQLRFINSEGPRLLVGYRCSNENICYGQDKVNIYNADGSKENAAPYCVNHTNSAVEDQQGRIWYGDDFGGIRYSNANSTDNCNILHYNSPFTAGCFSMVFKNDKLYVAPDGFTPSGEAITSRTGFFVYDGTNWSNYNLYTHPDISNIPSINNIVVGDDGTFYASCYYNGIAEVNANEVNVQYYANNDVIDGITSEGVFDSKGNLWFSNANPNAIGAPLLIVKKPNTDFAKTGPALSGKYPFKAIADDNDFLWFTKRDVELGLLVYDAGADALATNDDKYRIINLINDTNADLESARANCVVKDLDGAIWVGTGDGIVRFECGTNAFSSDCKGYRPRSVRDGINAYSLDDQDVRCIAVDGANRKWCGTNNGIILLSPDGSEEITSYTSENSPLFDNNINSIAINNKNGEVFIGTYKGIQSIRGEATTGGKLNSKNAYAFPNPVRPEYDGPIAIKGLARDANIKITDVNGQLVFETQALGGQAIWDAKDYNGRRVNSGVYLVFATNTQNIEDAETIITKILVIN